MTNSSTHQTRHTVVVPNSIDMVSLLGPGDEHLGIIERGSTPTSTSGATRSPRGDPGEVALAERLLDELVAIIRTGQGVTRRDRRAGDRACSGPRPRSGRPTC